MFWIKSESSASVSKAEVGFMRKQQTLAANSVFQATCTEDLFKLGANLPVGRSTKEILMIFFLQLPKI